MSQILRLTPSQCRGEVRRAGEFHILSSCQGITDFFCLTIHLRSKYIQSFIKERSVWKAKRGGDDEREKEEKNEQEEEKGDKGRE